MHHHYSNKVVTDDFFIQSKDVWENWIDKCLNTSMITVYAGSQQEAD